MATLTCPGCSHVLIPTTARPAVAAQSLGPGTYHLDCARTRWKQIAERTERKGAARLAERQAQGRKLTASRAETASCAETARAPSEALHEAAQNAFPKIVPQAAVRALQSPQPKGRRRTILNDELAREIYDDD